MLNKPDGVVSSKREGASTIVVDLLAHENVKNLSPVGRLDIGDEKPTLPAKAIRIGEKEIHLILHEGRFHQVKRMLKAVGNEVTGLKRIRMGGLILDESLAPGEYRELSDEELGLLEISCVKGK